MAKFSVKMGGLAIRVDDLEDASKSFRKWIETNGLGASDLVPSDGELHEYIGVGKHRVGRVAYNGRIFGMEGGTILFPPPAIRTPKDAAATLSAAHSDVVGLALQTFIDLADSGELNRSLAVDTAVQAAREALAKSGGAR